MNGGEINLGEEDVMLSKERKEKDMNRRELLHAASAVACVAAVPEVLTLPSFATVVPLAASEWTETPLTLNLRNTVTTTLKRGLVAKSVDRDGFNVHALTPAQWDTLGNQSEELWTLHAQYANCHHLDLNIQANATVLKQRFARATVDAIVHQGNYRYHYEMCNMMHAVAARMRGSSSAPSLEVQPFLSCGWTFVLYAAMWTIAGLLVPEIALLAAVGAIGMDAAGQFVCGYDPE